MWKQCGYALIAVGMMFTTVPTVACSIVYAMPHDAAPDVPGYQTPMALDLAERADAIVLARVTGGPDPKKTFSPRVILKPEIWIAGTPSPKELQISGYLAEDQELVAPSDPANIRDSHPEADTGACSRYTFKRDMVLLLFLIKQEQGYEVINSPFARTHEDVPNADALWVRAVRLYASVADKPRAEQEALLLKERERLLSTGNAEDAMIAGDIQLQLKDRQAASEVQQ